MNRDGDQPCSLDGQTHVLPARQGGGQPLVASGGSTFGGNRMGGFKPMAAAPKLESGGGAGCLEQRSGGEYGYFPPVR